MKLRIDEAIAQAKSKGVKVLKKDLAVKMWADSEAPGVNMSSLCAGKTLQIRPEWVKIICDATGVDANFLFNIKPQENGSE